MRAWVGRVRRSGRAGRTIGLVPTMGAFHAGHRSLMRRARRECDRVVVSLFVNPFQFESARDYRRYPRRWAADVAAARAERVDVVYAPSAREMFGTPPRVTVDPGPLGRRLEGACRPGHFQGVLTVVARLFHQIPVDRAYFGWKDYQQVVLIRGMVRDLGFPVQVVACPTVREKDGLACSSRNALLSPGERRRAGAIRLALVAANARFLAGDRRATALTGEMDRALKAEGVRADYVQVCDPRTLDPVDRGSAGDAALIAARIGRTRLIDNLVLGR